MRSLYFLAVVMMCCLLSCQKEPDASLLTPTSCNIERIVYYDSDDPIDTVGFEYTAGKATRVNYFSSYREIEYEGSYISKRTYYDKGTTNVWAMDEFTYNPDSSISRVDFYIVDPALPQPYLLYQFNFVYNAGKLSMLQTKIDTTGNGPEPYIDSYFTYSGDNISQVIQNYLEVQEADTLNYAYDTKQNYFGKQPNLWLSDALFSDFDPFLIPLALSANNVITVSDMQSNNIPLTYSETDKQHIESLTIDGELWSRYQYKCQ